MKEELLVWRERDQKERLIWYIRYFLPWEGSCWVNIWQNASQYICCLNLWKQWLIRFTWHLGAKGRGSDAWVRVFILGNRFWSTLQMYIVYLFCDLFHVLHHRQHEVSKASHRHKMTTKNHLLLFSRLVWEDRNTEETQVRRNEINLGGKRQMWREPGF